MKFLKQDHNLQLRQNYHLPCTCAIEKNCFKILYQFTTLFYPGFSWIFGIQYNSLDFSSHHDATNPTMMGAKTTTTLPPTPNVMPMVPPMMSSPVVGTMPPPPVIPSTVQSSTPSVASNALPSAMVPTPPPNSEVASNASSGGMVSPSPQQMMPASIPDIPLFGTGPQTNTGATQIPQSMHPPGNFQVHAMHSYTLNRSFLYIY